MSELSSSLSWCPLGVGARNAHGDITFSATQAAASELPELPDELTQPHCIYLPLENLLTRNFLLPLKQTRHLDASMLSQELADSAGINPDDWWLSWQARKVSNGISGLVFGLPNKIKQAFEENAALQQTPLLLVDGWVRLNSWLKNGPVEPDLDIAVIDTDAEGVFFGFFQAGSWQGMRRLNADLSIEAERTSLIQQISWSLQAMGFVADTMPVTGRLTTEMAHAFPNTLESLPLTIEETLPQRHMVNLMLPEPGLHSPELLNIRHGKWAVKSRSSISSQWFRPLTLAFAVSLLWLTLTTINNYQLEAQLAQKNDEIISAFHRGLPDQPVIIDALAQLRQASGGGESSTQARHVTQQLIFISNAFKQQSWQMEELKIDDKGTFIQGKTTSLDILNKIRENLGKESAAAVQILDTNLKGDEVIFKVSWQ